MVAEAGRGIDSKGTQGTFWGDETLLYLDCGVGYVCQNSPDYRFRGGEFYFVCQNKKTALLFKK